MPRVCECVCVCVWWYTIQNDRATGARPAGRRRHRYRSLYWRPPRSSLLVVVAAAAERFLLFTLTLYIFIFYIIRYKSAYSL